MRARICSAFSCDMFARVVWLKSWGAAKPPAFAPPFAARTRHAWLARITRARGRSFLRGRKALLNDFCRAFGHSKAREKKKLHYVSFFGHQRANPREWLSGVCSFHLFLFYSFAEFHGDCSLNEFYAAPVGKTARLIIIIGKPYRVRTVRITAEDSL